MKILKVNTEKRRIGDSGEAAAVKFLKRNGYKIKRRNFVAEGHEIDIIAEKDGILAFIEVKTRTLGNESPYEARPASAVTPEKQRKIIETAKAYLSYYPKERGKMLRLDVIEVLLNENAGASVNHMEAAFTADTAIKRYR